MSKSNNFMNTAIEHNGREYNRYQKEIAAYVMYTNVYQTGGDEKFFNSLLWQRERQTAKDITDLLEKAIEKNVDTITDKFTFDEMRLTPLYTNHIKAVLFNMEIMDKYGVLDKSELNEHIKNIKESYTPDKYPYKENKEQQKPVESTRENTQENVKDATEKASPEKASRKQKEGLEL